jgi:hypothetical protein
MSQAIFGLIGVVLGAVAAGVGDYLLGKRQERVATKRAGRLLLLELQEAIDFIESSLRELRWIADPARVLSNEVWVEQRAAFAQVDSAKTWEAVSGAFLRAADLRRKNQGAVPGTRLDPGDERTEDAEAVLPHLRLAVAGLSAFLD